MKPFTFRSIFALAAGLVLGASATRADDATVPPPTPPNAQASPEGGGGHPGKRGMRPEYLLADLTQKLSLTADQVTAVGAILDSGRAQGKAVHADTTLSREDMHQKMQAIRAATRQQIRAALTPAQQAIFDTLPQHGGKRPPPPPSN